MGIAPVSVRDMSGSSRMLNKAGTARLKMSLSCLECRRALPFRPAIVRIDSGLESARAVTLQVLQEPVLLGLRRGLHVLIPGALGSFKRRYEGTLLWLLKPAHCLASKCEMRCMLAMLSCDTSRASRKWSALT